MKFFTAKIVFNSSQTPSSTHLEVLPDPKILRSYKIPGQYSLIRLPGFKESFFALSNPPGEKTFSFLIKKSSPLAEKLAGLKKGDEIELSEIQGKGFDLKQALGKHVLLLAVGSAIGPIRASLLTLLKNPSDSKSLSLYFGALHPKDFAYADEFEEWQKKGVKIIQTVYPPDPSWKGLGGFVQDHLPKTLPTETAALVCGMDRMVQETTQKLIKLGVPKNRILVNI